MTQAHPDWTTERIKGAMMNTTKNPLPSLNVRTAGSGVLQIDKAIDSKVIADDTAGGTAALSFGYEPLNGAYSETLTLRLTNTGTRRSRTTSARPALRSGSNSRSTRAP